MNGPNDTSGEVEKSIGTYIYDIKELRPNYYTYEIIRNGHDKLHSESKQTDSSLLTVPLSARSSSDESSTIDESSTKDIPRVVTSRSRPRKKLERKATLYDEDDYALAGSRFSTNHNTNIDDNGEGDISPKKCLKETKCIYFVIFSVLVIPVLTGIGIVAFLLLAPVNPPGEQSMTSNLTTAYELGKVVVIVKCILYKTAFYYTKI